MLVADQVIFTDFVTKQNVTQHRNANCVDVKWLEVNDKLNGPIEFDWY